MDIEILEEYEDLIMPAMQPDTEKGGGSHGVLNSRQEPAYDNISESSESVDMDIFDESSDEEANAATEKVVEDLMQKRHHGPDDSEDSLEQLVRELAHDREEEPALETLSSCLKLSSNCDKLNTSSTSHKRVAFAPDCAVQYIEPLGSANTAAIVAAPRKSTIIKPEKILFKDPAFDPLSIEQSHLSDISSDDSFVSTTEIPKAAMELSSSYESVNSTANSSTSIPETQRPEKPQVISNEILVPAVTALSDNPLDILGTNIAMIVSTSTSEPQSAQQTTNEKIKNKNETLLDENKMAAGQQVEAAGKDFDIKEDLSKAQKSITIPELSQTTVEIEKLEKASNAAVETELNPIIQKQDNDINTKVPKNVENKSKSISKATQEQIRDSAKTEKSKEIVIENTPIEKTDKTKQIGDNEEKRSSLETESSISEAHKNTKIMLESSITEKSQQSRDKTPTQPPKTKGQTNAAPTNPSSSTIQQTCVKTENSDTKEKVEQFIKTDKKQENLQIEIGLNVQNTKLKDVVKTTTPNEQKITTKTVAAASPTTPKTNIAKQQDSTKKVVSQQATSTVNLEKQMDLSKNAKQTVQVTSSKTVEKNTKESTEKTTTPNRTKKEHAPKNANSSELVKSASSISLKSNEKPKLEKSSTSLNLKSQTNIKRASLNVSATSNKSEKSATSTSSKQTAGNTPKNVAANSKKNEKTVPGNFKSSPAIDTTSKKLTNVASNSKVTDKTTSSISLKTDAHKEPVKVKDASVVSTSKKLPNSQKIDRTPSSSGTKSSSGNETPKRNFDEKSALKTATEKQAFKQKDVNVVNNSKKLEKTASSRSSKSQTGNETPKLKIADNRTDSKKSEETPKTKIAGDARKVEGTPSSSSIKDQSDKETPKAKNAVNVTDPKKLEKTPSSSSIKSVSDKETPKDKTAVNVTDPKKLEKTPSASSIKNQSDKETPKAKTAVNVTDPKKFEKTPSSSSIKNQSDKETPKAKTAVNVTDPKKPERTPSSSSIKSQSDKDTPKAKTAVNVTDPKKPERTPSSSSIKSQSDKDTPKAKTAVNVTDPKKLEKTPSSSSIKRVSDKETPKDKTTVNVTDPKKLEKTPSSSSIKSVSDKETPKDKTAVNVTDPKKLEKTPSSSSIKSISDKETPKDKTAVNVTDPKKLEKTPSSSSIKSVSDKETPKDKTAVNVTDPKQPERTPSSSGIKIQSDKETPKVTSPKKLEKTPSSSSVKSQSDKDTPKRKTDGGDKILKKSGTLGSSSSLKSESEKKVVMQKDTGDGINIKNFERKSLSETPQRNAVGDATNTESEKESIKQKISSDVANAAKLERTPSSSNLKGQLVKESSKKATDSDGKIIKKLLTTSSTSKSETNKDSLKRKTTEEGANLKKSTSSMSLKCETAKELIKQKDVASGSNNKNLEKPTTTSSLKCETEKEANKQKDDGDVTKAKKLTTQSDTKSLSNKETPKVKAADDVNVKESASSSGISETEKKPPQGIVAEKSERKIIEQKIADDVSSTNKIEKTASSNSLNKEADRNVGQNVVDSKRIEKPTSTVSETKETSNQKATTHDKKVEKLVKNNPETSAPKNLDQQAAKVQKNNDNETKIKSLGKSTSAESLRSAEMTGTSEKKAAVKDLNTTTKKQESVKTEHSKTDMKIQQEGGDKSEEAQPSNDSTDTEILTPKELHKTTVTTKSKTEQANNKNQITTKQTVNQPNNKELKKSKNSTDKEDKAAKPASKEMNKAEDNKSVADVEESNKEKAKLLTTEQTKAEVDKTNNENNAKSKETTQQPKVNNKQIVKSKEDKNITENTIKAMATELNSNQSEEQPNLTVATKQPATEIHAQIQPKREIKTKAALKSMEPIKPPVEVEQEQIAQKSTEESKTTSEQVNQELAAAVTAEPQKSEKTISLKTETTTPKVKSLTKPIETNIDPQSANVSIEEKRQLRKRAADESTDLAKKPTKTSQIKNVVTPSLVQLKRSATSPAVEDSTPTKKSRVEPLRKSRRLCDEPSSEEQSVNSTNTEDIHVITKAPSLPKTKVKTSNETSNTNATIATPSTKSFEEIKTTTLTVQTAPTSIKSSLKNVYETSANLTTIVNEEVKEHPTTSSVIKEKETSDAKSAAEVISMNANSSEIIESKNKETEDQNNKEATKVEKVANDSESVEVLPKESSRIEVTTKASIIAATKEKPQVIESIKDQKDTRSTPSEPTVMTFQEWLARKNTSNETTGKQKQKQPNLAENTQTKIAAISQIKNQSKTKSVVKKTEIDILKESLGKELCDALSSETASEDETIESQIKLRSSPRRFEIAQQLPQQKQQQLASKTTPGTESKIEKDAQQSQQQQPPVTAKTTPDTESKIAEVTQQLTLEKTPATESTTEENTQQQQTPASESIIEKAANQQLQQSTSKTTPANQSKVSRAGSRRSEIEMLKAFSQPTITLDRKTRTEGQHKTFESKKNAAPISKTEINSVEIIRNVGETLSQDASSTSQNEVSENPNDKLKNTSLEKPNDIEKNVESNKITKTTTSSSSEPLTNAETFKPKRPRTELEILRESMSKEMLESGIDELMRAHAESPRCLTKRSIANALAVKEPPRSTQRNAKNSTKVTRGMRGTILLNTENNTTRQAFQDTHTEMEVVAATSVVEVAKVVGVGKVTAALYKNENELHLKNKSLSLSKTVSHEFKCRKLYVRINRNTVRRYFENLRKKTVLTSDANVLETQQLQSIGTRKRKATQMMNEAKKFATAAPTTSASTMTVTENQTITESQVPPQLQLRTAQTKITPCTSPESRRARTVKTTPTTTTKIVETKVNEPLTPTAMQTGEDLLLTPISVAPVLTTPTITTDARRRTRKKGRTNTKVTNTDLTRPVTSNRAAITTTTTTQPVIPAQPQKSLTPTLQTTPTVESFIAPKREMDEEEFQMRSSEETPTTTAEIATTSRSQFTTAMTMTTPRIPLVISGATSHSLPPAFIDNAGTRLYSYLHPTRYNSNHGNVMLDYCCPNLDGPMTAIDPTRRHDKIDAAVRELPQFITMETRLVTRAELEANSNCIPAAIRHKVQRMTNAKSTPTATTPIQTVEAAPTTPISTNNTLKPINLTALQKQLPATTTLTPKTGPTQRPNIRTAAGVSSAATSTMKTTTITTPTAIIKPTTLEEMRAKIRVSLKNYDILLRKHYPRISMLSFADRQKLQDSMVNSTQLMSRDIDVASRVLQEYVTHMAMITAREPTPQSPPPSLAPVAPVTAATVATVSSVVSKSTPIATTSPTTRAQAKNKTTKRVSKRAPKMVRKTVPIYSPNRNIIGYQVQMVPQTTIDRGVNMGTKTSSLPSLAATTASTNAVDSSFSSPIASTSAMASVGRRSGIFVIDQLRGKTTGSSTMASSTPILTNMLNSASVTTAGTVAYQSTSHKALMHSTTPNTTAAAGSVVTRSGRGVNLRQQSSRATTKKTRLHETPQMLTSFPLASTTSTLSTSLPSLPTLTRNPHLPPLNDHPSFDTNLKGPSRLIVVNHDLSGNPLPMAEESILPDECSNAAASVIKNETMDY